MTARRDREPMACLKSSTLILTISRVERFTPVRFPPGRSQLEMSPVATKSPPTDTITFVPIGLLNQMLLLVA